MQNSQIAKRIKERCKICNVAVSILLINCGINKNFIYDLEKKDKSPSADKLILIADYLDCSVDYLLNRTDKPNSHKL